MGEKPVQQITYECMVYRGTPPTPGRQPWIQDLAIGGGGGVPLRLLHEING